MPTPDQVAPGWKLDSGISPMDLIIHAAYFSTSADYQNGSQYLLFLIGEDENGEPSDQIKMSVGADWYSTDGGRTIVHQTKKVVGASTIYGHFIHAALELEDRPQGKTLYEVLSAKGDATNAEVWVNIKLHLDPVEIKFGRGLDPVTRLMPTKFLGVYDDAAAQQQAAAMPATPGVPAAPVAPPMAAPPIAPPVAAAPPAPPVAPGPVAQPPMVPAAPPAPVPGVPVPATMAEPTLTPQQAVAQAQEMARQQATSNGSPLFQEMLDLARNSASFEAFQAAAVGRADVLADEELVVQIMDPSKIWTMTHS